MPAPMVVAAVGAVPAALVGLTVCGVLLLGDSPEVSAATGAVAPLQPGMVPAAYTNDVEAAAAGCAELSPALLAAQLQQESGFNSDATSPAGAQGIAQFMPGTWLTWGGDADGDGDASAFDPEDAIAAQGRLMCDLLRRAAVSGLGGDPVQLALAGYNAGWGAVTTYGGIPPYAETRAYVAAITGGLQQFDANDGIGQVVWPIAPGAHTLGSGFGQSGDLWVADHTGQDFVAPCGTPVVAVTAGTAVISPAETSWAGPHHVKITAADGTQTWYAHMAGTTITSGQTVRSGQQIGYIGTEGNSTGCHLHLEVRPQGSAATDPLPWLNRHGSSP